MLLSTYSIYRFNWSMIVLRKWRLGGSILLMNEKWTTFVGPKQVSKLTFLPEHPIFPPRSLSYRIRSLNSCLFTSSALLLPSKQPTKPRERIYYLLELNLLHSPPISYFLFGLFPSPSWLAGLELATLPMFRFNWLICEEYKRISRLTLQSPFIFTYLVGGSFSAAVP